MEMKSYVTGFVDGEGSFLVSFSKRSKFKTGIEVRPSFTVSQHRRNLEILKRIQQFFNCGSIRFDRHDQTYKYEVRSLCNLWERIIPHFEACPLQTSKANDFVRFKDVCRIMRSNEHRSRSGMEWIITLAYGMNNIGARKHEREDFLRIVGKMKV
jgi:hypothetical protein